jgi:hypothetical protein
MRTSNELSTLYKSIDQKNISESAKETLKKIRLANKNFKGKDEDAQELFIDFFNKLKSSKPVAVKTTQEYKDALKKAQIERGRKMREGKGKPKEPKAEGNEVDANRPAKPFGWRMRGKHNYRKPTRDDISKGRAYYEGRVNRADVKRKKYPMLERGGKLEEKVFSIYPHSVGKAKYVIDVYDGNATNKDGSPFIGIRTAQNKGKLNSTISSLKEDGFKEVDNVFNYLKTYEDGGYMAKGGETSEDISECKKLVSAFCEKFGEKFGLNEEKVLNEVKFQDYLGYGASVFISLSVTSNMTDLKVGETKPIAGYIKLTSDINPNGITGKDDIARTYTIDIEIKGDKRYTQRRIEEGKYFKSYNYGRTIEDVMEETSSKIFYDLNPLERQNDLKFKMSTLFAKGGAIENQYEGRTPKDIWDNLTKPQRSHFIYDHAEQIEGLKEREIETSEIRKAYKSNYADLDEDIKNRFDNHTRVGQYAKGGTIGGMSTYVSARDIEEIKLTINGDMKTLKGSDLMDGVYVKKASLKAKFDAYEVYNKLADMSYDIWDKLKIESGSQIENSDSLQKKLQEEYEKVGIDSLFKSLTKLQRAKVAKILTDENQHSLRNYLALRGYEGEKEYQSYKDGYDNQPKGRKYYLSPYVITRVVTMAEGGEVFYTEKHKND